ncbi:MAG TPA: MFS transporter [Dehalococcoidia bacterium]|nr:MFS transporter [Dehalococcoidia bacterium]
MATRSQSSTRDSTVDVAERGFTPPASEADAPLINDRGGRSGVGSLRTFDSLSIVPFRWFLLAMLGQFGASNMQMLASGYLVFDLTGSFAALGAISLASAIPMFAFSPVGGVLADRLPRKMVLQVGQLMNGLIAAGVAALLFLDLLTFTHLLISAGLQGMVWATMMPARQAMIPDVVGEERLMNAVALNTAGMNLMRLAAPGLGGLLIAAFGAAWAYSLMASGFFFAAVTLSRVPMKPSVAADRDAGASVSVGATARRSMTEFREAMSYIAREKNVRVVLIANFVIVLFSMPYMMLLPGFVADVLNEGPDKLGLLMTLTGLGSVAGSLLIASMPNKNRGKILLGSSVLLGVALIAFVLSRSLLLTAVIMIPIGLGQTGRMSLSNVLLQAYVDDAYRGRVMSVYMMEFSIVSFGVFGVGLLSSVIGVDWAIGMTAVGLTIVATAGFFTHHLRDLD